MHISLEQPGETLSLVGRYIRVFGTAYEPSGESISVKASIGGREDMVVWGLPNFDAFDGTEASYMSGFTKIIDLGDEAKKKEFELLLRFAASSGTQEFRRTVKVKIDNSSPRPSLLAAGTQSDFRVFGDGFLAYMIEEGLQPTSRAVEIGPGAGRLSVAVARHLNAGGALVAFDVDPSAVEFCTHNIAKRYPWAQFHHQNVLNRVYNPTGTQNPSRGVLDAQSATFDFAYCWSVFTHLVQDDFKIYLREFARLLKPGGKAVFSVFVHGPNLKHNFVPMGHGFWTTNLEKPEAAIAVDEEVLARMVRNAGFKRVDIRRLASTAGALSGQDVVVAIR